ncbi:MAG: glycosyltransferase [Patescibacteria group bacterium]
MPLVSIIILGYNSKKYLKLCFEAIFAQSYSNLEIIYVDNASSDDSLKVAESLLNKNIKIIKNEKNLGYAGGQNCGIRNSSGEFVLCLNPDIILDKDYIKNIVELFQKNKKIGAVTGKLLKFKIIPVCHSERRPRFIGVEVKNPPAHQVDPSAASRLQDDIIEKTNIIDSCGLEIFKSHRVVERGGGEIESEISNLKSRIYNISQKIFGVSGAAPIFRKSALETIRINSYKKFVSPSHSYFDEDFFSYKEDIDLSFRLLHAGFECWFEPKALAWHHRWETGSQEIEKTKDTIKRRKKRSILINFLSYRNHMFFLLKNEFLSNLILYFPWIFIYEIKKLIFGLFFDKSIIYGFWNFLKFLPLTLKKRRDILSKSKIKPKDIRKWLK